MTRRPLTPFHVSLACEPGAGRRPALTAEFRPVAPVTPRPTFVACVETYDCFDRLQIRACFESFDQAREYRDALAARGALVQAYPLVSRYE